MSLAKEANDRADQLIKLELIIQAQRYIILAEYCLLRYDKAKDDMLTKKKDILLNRLGNLCSWLFVLLMIYLTYKRIKG